MSEESGPVENLAHEIALAERAIIMCLDCGAYEVNNLDDDAVEAAHAAGGEACRNGRVRATEDEVRAAIDRVIADSHLDCPGCNLRAPDD